MAIAVEMKEPVMKTFRRRGIASTPDFDQFKVGIAFRY